MTPETITLIIPAFIAGILTFLAPCTLPLVPAYLGFISGVSAEKLKDPTQAAAARNKIFLNGSFFVLGFTAVFVSFGILAGLFGQILMPFRVWLTKIAGIIIIMFGISMLKFWNIPLLGFLISKERRIRMPGVKPGSPTSSAILGGAFAFGWTPCVGPILGSILFLTASSATALSGGFLLLIFSLGLAIPFLLTAIGLGSVGKIIKYFAAYLPWVERIAGVVLIFIGWLLLTNNFGFLITYGYQLLQFINYDRLLNYL